MGTGETTGYRNCNTNTKPLGFLGALRNPPSTLLGHRLLVTAAGWPVCILALMLQDFWDSQLVLDPEMPSRASRDHFHQRLFLRRWITVRVIGWHEWDPRSLPWSL